MSVGRAELGGAFPGQCGERDAFTASQYERMSEICEKIANRWYLSDAVLDEVARRLIASGELESGESR